MIKGVAFDLDGTIVDLERIHFDGFIHAAREFGIFLDFDDLLVKIPGAIGGGDQKIAEGIARLGDGIKPARVKGRKKYHYDRLLHDLTVIEPRHGFLKIFHELRRHDLKVAIGSSTPRRQGLHMMEKARIVDLFPTECVVFAEDVKNLKPAPDSYLKTANGMQIHPSEQMVFEDSAIGIKAAVASGSLGIGVPVFRFQWLLDQIRDAGACKIFSQWDEIDVQRLLKEFNDKG